VLWGELADRFRTGAGEIDFARLFQAPAWLAVAAMLLLVVAFHPERRRARVAEAAAPGGTP
jgi:hypothetical protein